MWYALSRSVRHALSHREVCVHDRWLLQQASLHYSFPPYTPRLPRHAQPARQPPGSIQSILPNLHNYGQYHLYTIDKTRKGRGRHYEYFEQPVLIHDRQFSERSLVHEEKKVYRYQNRRSEYPLRISLLLKVHPPHVSSDYRARMSR